MYIKLLSLMQIITHHIIQRIIKLFSIKMKEDVGTSKAAQNVCKQGQDSITQEVNIGTKIKQTVLEMYGQPLFVQAIPT